MDFDDYSISTYASKVGGVVVTCDKGFPHPRKIVLPMMFRTQRGTGKPKYEKLWTALCEKLREVV